MKKIPRNNLIPYETDASGIRGNALNVFHPKTIMRVREIVVLSKRICIRGGGTGFVGGAVPGGGLDVVLDLSKLDGIGPFDKERKTIEVEAGIILDDLQDYLFEYGLEFPINPLSHSVCTIGGMIATNASGSRIVKFGHVSDWVKWIEVVDGNGVLHRKGITEMGDYVGMEGITGVIVKACLNLYPLKERSATFVRIEILNEVIEKVKDLKKNVNVCMIEFLDKKISKLLGLEENYHLAIEYEGDFGLLKGKEYFEFLDKLGSIYSVVGLKGYTRIEDFKFFLDKIPSLINLFEKKGIPVFGHISVGILHPCFSKEQEKLIPEITRVIQRFGGHISGEYGIGILKKEFIDINDARILINIKKRTDPLNKFNVGKVI